MYSTSFYLWIFKVCYVNTYFVLCNIFKILCSTFYSILKCSNNNNNNNNCVDYDRSNNEQLFNNNNRIII